MRRGLAAIDRIHKDGALPTIAVVRQPILDAEAYYDIGASPKIVVGEQARHPGLSFVHEVGHFIDHQGIGKPGRWGTTRSMELQAWRDAIRATISYRLLRQMRRSGVTGPRADAIRYLMRPQELWARSYTQYVATRSGDPTLLAELAARRTLANGARSPAYWDDADFAPVADAIEALFRVKGWMP